MRRIPGAAADLGTTDSLCGSSPWRSPVHADCRMTPQPITASRETLTVIHGGAEIAELRASELLEAATNWYYAAIGPIRVVEVWAAPWQRVVASWLATAAAFGAPVYGICLAGGEDLVAALNARGVRARYRQARKSVVEDAELRATCNGWPVHYV